MKFFRAWYIWVAAPLLLAACLLFGSSGIGLPDMSTPSGMAILKLRLYRVAAGFIVGGGLSCAGAVLQAILKNPLAEPYVLGVSGGAGLGAALSIVLGVTGLGALMLPVTAFVFGLLSLSIVYVIAQAGGRLSIYSLILSGVIVSSVCSSLLMFLISVSPVEGLHSVMWWMLGNLEVSDLQVFHVSSIVILAALGLSWLFARELNALSLGKEMAHNVGVRTGLYTVIGLVCATVAASACVGISGMIGFVGLIVPHVVRGMTGPDHRKLIPAVILCGGAFLAVCDAVARVALLPFGPYELPVGVVTSLVGGPFFMVILYHRRRSSWVE